MRLSAILVFAVAVAVCVAPPASAAPPGWPSHLAVGVADQPGGAAGVAARRLDARYQYLAGRVDTGNGWATWNEDATFVSRYVAESRRAGVLPVLTYYMLLQSGTHGGGEAQRDLANLRDEALMRTYYADLRLALRRAAGTRAVLHVEPDLWGYVQQHGGDDASSVPAAVSRSGDPELAGLPDTAAGYAQAVVRLRDRHAPSVLLAWHLSSWGTNDSVTANDLPAARIDALAARSARFYRSLGAGFDLVFNDVADRDDGFRRVVLGERVVGHHWGRGDVRRHFRYLRGVSSAVDRPIVLWQLPLGHRRLPNTHGRYRDNRVDLLLGSRRNLRRARAAGVIGLLFGAGAEGCTTPQTDGGHFFRLARRYARARLPLL
ncbi:MAG TPA: hypothetical protein VGW10_16165 [Solirubrobacteraceae bacterium]|nr:hypothetical protein [Solirubrobacteraceae bacterium]